MQTRFSSIDTQTVLLAARVDVEVTVDGVDLLDVHVVNEPLCPHRVLRAGLFELAVPLARQGVGHVRTKVRVDGGLVFVKPVLNTTTAMLLLSTSLSCCRRLVVSNVTNR